MSNEVEKMEGRNYYFNIIHSSWDKVMKPMGYEICGADSKNYCYPKGGGLDSHWDF